MTSLSVVVPATNAPPSLGRCLAAIRSADRPPDEIVVVDDPALSAAAARNRGAQRATGDLVVFVDADVVVHADAFERVLVAFAADPALSAVFGAYDDEPDDGSLVSTFRNLLHHHVHHEGAGPAETFWTGLGAVRRDAFLALGGFDEERYPHPSIEDIEFGDRLHRSGARVVLDPSIQGTHLKVWGLGSMLWTDLVHRAIPWVGLQVRTRRAARTLNCGWPHRASALAVLVAPLVALVGAPVLIPAVVAAFIAINRRFYGLLLRRVGPGGALAGVVLHGLHHAVAIAAVPIGVVVAARAGVAGSRAEGAVPAVNGMVDS